MGSLPRPHSWFERFAPRSFFAGARRCSLLVLLGLLALPPALRAISASDPRIALPGSIHPVPATTPVGASTATPHVARSTLLASEYGSTMQFQLSLKMRNFAELQARLANGEIISPAEMEERYWPLPADYTAAAGWLKQQGFTLSTTEPSRLLITAAGTVAQVRNVFQVNFARVSSDGQEFTSAITAPSVPATLAPMLVGINGLQPHLRKHPNLLMHPNSSTGFVPPFFPNQIKQAYGASALGLDGTGQTIAIVMSAFPSGNVSTSGNTSNLNTFWTTTGITRTGTYTAIAVGAGPRASASSIDAEEACLDAEWSSSIAPGANIRFYGIGSLSSTDTDSAYQKIYNDASAHPEFGLHVVSLSFGGSESSSSQLLTDDQLFAQLVSLGITVFASSGDNGSSSGAESPASDPNVTGVGGTSITVNSSGVVTSETGWSGSGGNTSGFFPKPSWQTGPGVLTTSSFRQVPDLAAPADPSTGCLIVWNGGSSTTVGGTSWSAPTWAGFAALINQGRAQNHVTPLGLLNSKIYPLLGTSSFRDITSGSNGGFNAASGYDLVTGVGVPVFPDLLTQLLFALNAPPNAEVNAGANASFAIDAGTAATSFQWQRMAAGTSTWANLTEDSTYAGVLASTLTINATTAAMSGDQFRCVVNIGITPSATLIVLPQLLYVSTLAGNPGGPGISDGQGENAQFDLPNDVALDANGNIFVADTFNDAIRKVTPSGNVTTFAGQTGIPGYVNAVGTAAQFNFDNSLDFDSGGNIYVADSNNNAIRKITPGGNVTTFAGSTTGLSGNTNGAGANARFNFPAGIAVAANGTVFVADSSNDLIRKITPAGNVTTLAGSAGLNGFTDGTTTHARFDFPAAVAVDSGGNIFVADANNNIIRKITPAGNVTTFAGAAQVQGVADGPGTFARFNYPSGIAIDSANNLYVTDTNNNAIRKITPAGNVSTIAGQAGVQGSNDGFNAEAQFNQPYGVVVNNSTGVIYIADLFNHTIRQIQVATAPQLQTQSGNLTVLAGDPAGFNVTVNGVPAPSYQWQRLPAGNATWANLTDDGLYSGTATASLAINATTTAMNGDQFQCLISNGVGNLTSNAVTLAIYTPLQFTLQPADQAVTAGGNATFTATAAGFPSSIIYQWQMQLNGGTWANLTDNGTVTGSNTSVLTLGSVGTALGSAQLRAVASNGVSPNATSAAATLTVYPPGYLLWAGGLNLAGTSAQLSAQPFGDTIPNLARFAMNLGAHPAPADLPALIVQSVGGISYLTLDYNVNKALVGEQVIAQYSFDLQTWQPVSPTYTVQLVDPNSQTSRYEAQVAIPASGTVFLRLVIQPAP